MKNLFTSAVPILVLTVILYSCKEEENLSSIKGKIAFSPSQTPRIDGRTGEIENPAFVLLSIKDSNGITQENMKLSLLTFGQGYISESLEFETGKYQLTEFILLDSSSNAIYATPIEGSKLSQYVDDALPIEFIVGNSETRVTPQVLAVEATDNPEPFGYVSFGFDVVSRVTNLNLQIHHPDSGSYDSAYIVFKNAETEIKKKLILNNSTYTATGVVANIPSGNWNISSSFFSTIEPNYESLEKTGVINLEITHSATDLITTEGFAFIKDGNDAAQKSIDWVEYYYYQLYLRSASNTVEGFVRLPKDPTNPFVEIRTFEQKWIYAYVDRSFYNSSSDGTSNFFQGGGAFEIYGQYGKTHDRLSANIIDTTSLAPGISKVANKVWNFVDAVIIIAGTTPDEELLLYHVWDFRTSPGRISTARDLSRLEIEKRKQIHLH
jgi:hypothetical protein